MRVQSLSSRKGSRVKDAALPLVTDLQEVAAQQPFAKLFSALPESKSEQLWQCNSIKSAHLIWFHAEDAFGLTTPLPICSLMTAVLVNSSYSWERSLCLVSASELHDISLLRTSVPASFYVSLCWILHVHHYFEIRIFWIKSERNTTSMSSGLKMCF